jgi:hypothetical protein
MINGWGIIAIVLMHFGGIGLLWLLGDFLMNCFKAKPEKTSWPIMVFQNICYSIGLIIALDIARRIFNDNGFFSNELVCVVPLVFVSIILLLRILDLISAIAMRRMIYCTATTFIFIFMCMDTVQVILMVQEEAFFLSSQPCFCL